MQEWKKQTLILLPHVVNLLLKQYNVSPLLPIGRRYLPYSSQTPNSSIHASSNEQNASQDPLHTPVPWVSKWTKDPWFIVSSP